MRGASTRQEPPLSRPAAKRRYRGTFLVVYLPDTTRNRAGNNGQPPQWPPSRWRPTAGATGYRGPGPDSVGDQEAYSGALAALGTEVALRERQTDRVLRAADPIIAPHPSSHRSPASADGNVGRSKRGGVGEEKGGGARNASDIRDDKEFGRRPRR